MTQKEPNYLRYSCDMELLINLHDSPQCIGLRVQSTVFADYARPIQEQVRQVTGIV